MVRVYFHPQFERTLRKIKVKTNILRKIKIVIANPEIGKPMRYARKNTRELYTPPFRLSYAYKDDEIIFLALYHKDEQ